MKSRTGFVSNSSSSSFILKFDGDTLDYFKKLITDKVYEDFKNKFSEYFDYYEDYEIYSEIGSKEDLAQFIVESCTLHKVEHKYVGFQLIARGGDGPDMDDKIWYCLVRVLEDYCTFDESY